MQGGQMKYSLLFATLCMVILFTAAPGIAQDNNTAASQIDAMVGNDEIVIGDQTYKIASNAEFYARDERTKISLSRFDEGDWIEFSVNAEGEIDGMWFSSE
jgi:hypothetical protein